MCDVVTSNLTTTTTKINILCIVPARKGSKGIIDKNIKLYNGQPLMFWSIRCALTSKYYDTNNTKMRVIVSTDDEEYAHIAIKCGAECPFLRPMEYSCDFSPDIDFIKHTVDELKKTENYVADMIIQLRPTYPTRTTNFLDDCIKTFINVCNEYDSLRTVIKVEKTPYKMYNIIHDIDNNTYNNSKNAKKLLLKPLFDKVNDIEEPYNQCRQMLPTTYMHNGCIDILNSSILEQNTISGNNIYPIIMKSDETNDIDNINDWNKSLVAGGVL